MVALALAVSGCKPRTRIDLHYLPDFVPGSQNVFRPVRIAVPPTTGNVDSGNYKVGAIYAADGTEQTPLVVADAARTFNNALIKGLADAGLMPVALDSNPGDGKPPEGSDFILTSDLEQLEVNKRFEAIADRTRPVLHDESRGAGESSSSRIAMAPCFTPARSAASKMNRQIPSAPRSFCRSRPNPPSLCRLHSRAPSAC